MRLVLDGTAVPATTLRRLVSGAVRQVATARLGPGAVLEVDRRDALSVVVAVEVAEATGAVPAFGVEDASQVAGLARLRLRARRSGDCELTPVARGRASLPPSAAAVFRTSGTTGTPQLVVLSSAGLAYQAHATAERLGIEPQDGLLLPLPLGHAYGFSVLRTARLRGATLYVETAQASRGVVQRLRTARVTTLDAVPSLYRHLLAQARQHAAVRAALGALRIRGCGGDVLPHALAQEFVRHVGAPLHDGYGLTEAGPNVALSTPETWAPGTVGLPLAGTRVRVDRAGEVLVRSPSVMLEYLGDDAATQATLDSRGWLRTGDLGALDAAGRLTVHGRIKRAIVVHGAVFPPSLIERAAEGVAGVREAVAIGLPGAARRGDRIVLFVDVALERWPTLEPRIWAACRRELQPGLRPHRLQPLAALPRLVSGKPDVPALQASARALAAREAGRA